LIKDTNLPKIITFKKHLSETLVILATTKPALLPPTQTYKLATTSGNIRRETGCAFEYKS
jgi:hypothetical protein